MVGIGLALGAGMLNRAKRNIEEDKAREAAEKAYKRKKIDEKEMLDHEYGWKAKIELAEARNAELLDRRKRTISIVPGIPFTQESGLPHPYSKFANFQVPEGIGSDDIPGQIFNEIDNAAALDPTGFRNFVGKDWNTPYAFHLKGSLTTWIDSSNRKINEKGATNEKGGTVTLPGFEYYLPNISRMDGALDFYYNKVVPDFLNKNIGKNNTVVETKQTMKNIDGNEVPSTDLKVINNNEVLFSVEQGISEKIVDKFPYIYTPIKNKKGNETGRYVYNRSNFKPVVADYVTSAREGELRRDKNYKVIINSTFVNFPHSVHVPGGGPDMHGRRKDTIYSGTKKTADIIKNNERMLIAGSEMDWMIQRYVDLHYQLNLSGTMASAGTIATDVYGFIEGITGPGGFKDFALSLIGDARKGILRPLEEVANLKNSEKIEALRKKIVPTGSSIHQDKYINSKSGTYRSGEDLTSRIVYDNNKTWTNPINGNQYSNAKDFIDRVLSNAEMEIGDHNNIDVSKKTLKDLSRGDIAALRALQIMIAYRFAVIIQGGEGGRTVSDFDFANALVAIGANKKIQSFRQVMGYIGEVQAKTLRQLPISYAISEYGHTLAGTPLVELATDIGNHQAEELSVHAGYGTTYPEGYNPENVDTLDRRNWRSRNIWDPIKNVPKNIGKVWDDTKQMFVDEEEKESDVKKDVYGREKKKTYETKENDPTW